MRFDGGTKNDEIARLRMGVSAAATAALAAAAVGSTSDLPAGDPTPSERPRGEPVLEVAGLVVTRAGRDVVHHLDLTVRGG